MYQPKGDPFSEQLKADIDKRSKKLATGKAFLRSKYSRRFTQRSTRRNAKTTG